MARDMGDQVGQAAGTVQEQAGQLAGSVQEQASEMAGMVMDQTRQAPGQLQEMMAGSPLMTAALAATVGAAVGLALPATETESRVIGPMRDRVMGRAQEVTDDTIEKVSSVAQEVQSTVTREARSQGLTV